MHFSIPNDTLTMILTTFLLLIAAFGMYEAFIVPAGNKEVENIMLRETMLNDVHPNAYLMWKSGDSSITYNAIEEDFNRMINWYTDRRLTIPEWLIDDYKKFLKNKTKVKKQRRNKNVHKS